ARGQAPEQIHLGLDDVLAMVDRCRNCHQQEYAQWRSGPHSTTYARIFMDPEHNRKRLLMDDCLRCHGMHFQGAIGDVVQPLNTKGPWTLRDVKLVSAPAIPCLACHSMHREGQPMMKQEWPRVGGKQELFRPSLALMDRRSQMSLSLAYLPLPRMYEGARQVRTSPDRRQALCYQCHAPLADAQVHSGDDRTPVGVHEGLSCLACHQKHGQQTRASCADCHPRLSNCGLDVEKMDTTFLSPRSGHDIHFVKCADCHTKGVPPRKINAGLAAAAPRAPGGSR
ncbi:MAG: cytochrome c family protein, partial [Acidobacteria bacterium]|nr:cytochrome c family protein [Acidobacteriota bacterium]